MTNVSKLIKTIRLLVINSDKWTNWFEIKQNNKKIQLRSKDMNHFSK